MCVRKHGDALATASKLRRLLVGSGGQCLPALGRGGSVKPTWCKCGCTSTNLSLSDQEGGLCG